MDCCHSGTIGDLPVLRSMGHPDECVRYLPPPRISRSASRSLGDSLNGPRRCRRKLYEAARELCKVSGKQMVIFSGCEDSQTSADATIDGQTQGAMSCALNAALQKNQFKVAHGNLLNDVRELVKSRGFKQVPAFSSTHKQHWESTYLVNI